MGIDGIGKGPRGPQGGGAISGPTGTGTAPATSSGAAERPFEVRRETTGAVRDVAPVDVASPLEQLRAGKIDLDGYIDAKIARAVESPALKGLPAAELDALKRALRDQIAGDPAIADLVRQATGREPPTPDDA